MAQVQFSPGFIAEQFLIEQLLNPGKTSAAASAGPCGAWAGFCPRKAHCHAREGSPGGCHRPHSDAEGSHRRRRAPPHWWTGGKAMDIVEAEEYWVIITDVPGYSIKDLQVVVNDGAITISGDNTSQPPLFPEDAKVHRSERRTSTNFSRAFELPEGTDTSGIRAKVDNGILRVTLPKAEPAPKPAPVTIPIEDPMEAEATAPAAPADEAAPAADTPPTAAAANVAGQEGAASPTAAQAEGWVDVEKDVKGKAPMERELATEVERQMNELKMQQAEESD